MATGAVMMNVFAGGAVESKTASADPLACFGAKWNCGRHRDASTVNGLGRGTAASGSQGIAARARPLARLHRSTILSERFALVERWKQWDTSIIMILVWFWI
ncbi:hypothetical protein DB459_04605 [Bradyrhizobium sp. WD16]|nr:hypothetical protein DB459_04605 [Bradyrhizobium sp. WD16]